MDAKIAVMAVDGIATESARRRRSARRASTSSNRGRLYGLACEVESAVATFPELQIYRNGSIEGEESKNVGPREHAIVVSAVSVIAALMVAAAALVY